MGIRFNDFAIKGIDVSTFNDYVDWEKVRQAGVNFSAIRAGYGDTTDGRFVENWKNAKGKVSRFAYWYMDYYSNWYNPHSKYYGVSDAGWGKIQAQNCWNLIKLDNDKIITFLDIESGLPSYSPKITTQPATSHAHQIARAFLKELDRLSGLFNGIYCSTGMLSWYPSDLRDRPLWTAWYTDYQNYITIKQTVAKNGWTGKCLMWQYTSDGDVDDDGIGDGKKIGSSYNTLDLNGWIGTAEEYSIFINSTPPVPPPPPVPEVPLFKAKIIVPSLNIRKGSGTTYPVVGTAINGQIFEVYETNGYWMRIGVDKWIYGISSYVLKISIPTSEDGTVSNWIVTASSGLNIRSVPNTTGTKLGWMPYNTKFSVTSVDSNNWGKLYGKPGYVCLLYAKKIEDPSESTGRRPTSLEYPLPFGIRISQYFGSNPSWYPQSKGHNGIDWACTVGTPIYAMQDGIVIRASLYSQPGITDGKVGYGRHVRIQHKEGISIYGHLSRLDVKEGDIVKAKQQIGLSGGATSDPYSGFSTGAHLHAEYRVTNLPNPVPGGYVYNAFDFLPILIEPELPTGVTKWKVTATAGLNIRSAPSSAGTVIGALAYDEIFYVSSIDSNNWGKLYNREGYCALNYAKRI